MIPGIVASVRAGNTDFVLTVATTGSAETVTIPCGNIGTYNATIDWGDSSQSTITTYNDADLAHEYATADTYTVTISGTLPWIYFNNGGDKLKLKTIENWGQVGVLSCSAAFRGCSNLVVNATDTPDMSAVTNFANMFRSCTLFNGDISGWNVSSGTSFTAMFFNCSAFNQDIGSWNVSSGTTFSSMFNSCSAFNQDIGSWNVSSGTTFAFMFSLCSSLTTLNVSSWDTSSVTTMSAMFNGCTSLTGLDISGWNIASVTQMTSMLLNADALTTAVYDATLIAWEGQVEKTGVTAHFGAATYTSGGAAETARTTLTTTSSWTITDGGAA